MSCGAPCAVALLLTTFRSGSLCHLQQKVQKPHYTAVPGVQAGAAGFRQSTSAVAKLTEAFNEAKRHFETIDVGSVPNDSDMHINAGNYMVHMETVKRKFKQVKADFKTIMEQFESGVCTRAQVLGRG